MRPKEVIQVTAVSISIVWAVVLGIVLGAAHWTEPTSDWPPPKVLDNVLRITAEGETLGSAVLMKDGYVATNFHVLSAASTGMQVRTRNSDEGVEIQSALADPDTDAGIVRSGMRGGGLEFYSGPVPVGTTVYAAGYPLGGNLVVTKGNYMGPADFRSWIRHTAQTMNGMSGGAVLMQLEGNWVLIATMTGVNVQSVEGSPFGGPWGSSGMTVGVPFLGLSTPAKDHLALMQRSIDVETGE